MFIGIKTGSLWHVLLRNTIKESVMCELFGVNTSEKIQLNTLLKTFFSHGTKHPHGWGMAFLNEDMIYIEKQAVAANKSTHLMEYLEKPLTANKMIAHIRFATKGNIDYENCHPFTIEDNTGRIWTLAHNGTVFEGGILDLFFYVQEGQTVNVYYILLLNRPVNGSRRKDARCWEKRGSGL